MIKRIFQITSFIVIFCLHLGAYAQAGGNLYLINFKDKNNNSHSLNDPSKFLSERAIERRQKYGIPITESDLPVSDAYIGEIEQLGLDILVESKWLNSVIAHSDDPDLIDEIEMLGCVRKAAKANELMKSLDLPEQEKPFFMLESYSDSYDIPYADYKNVSELDYGASFNQIDMINGVGLHNDGFTGEGMLIAVLDAGFTNVNELEIFDSLWVNNRIMGTRDYVEPGNDVFAPGVHDHGMMVLSVMGGNQPGMLVGTAPDASYFLIRTEDGSAEYLMEEYFWVQGAEYADSLGADIINSSLGYTEFDDPEENHTYADLDGNTTVITIGADMAAQKGILVCNSAGNYADDDWLYIGAPADGDSVFTIGAVDPEGNWSEFSSIGPTYDGRIKPDIAGQGSQTIVAAPWGGIFAGNGTSFSSPLIAGMTACLWQANPDYSNMEVMQALKQSASQYSEPDEYLGYGIPDYVEAYNILGTVDITRKEILLDVDVSPNPFSYQINVFFNGSDNNDAIIEIMDVTGNIVLSIEAHIPAGSSPVTIDTSRLTRGLYVLRVIAGNRISSKKIIKS